MKYNSKLNRGQISVLALCIALTVSALPLSSAHAATETASTPDSAEARDTTEGLADIVVTAQKRSERLQDVPIAVAAVTSAQLQTSGVSGLTDLRVSVTGLNSVETAGYYTPRLRGIGSSALGPGIENAVATYVDGVYLASAQSALMSLNNIAQVEVLKGPQGTLFGRNATGGLIQVFTRDPDGRTTADINLSYANYRTITASAYVATGIANGVAADIALRYSHQGDGWGINRLSGQDVYRQDQDFSSRSKWILTPGDTTKITFIGDYNQKKGSTLVYNVVPGTKGFYNNAVVNLPDWDTNVNVEPWLAGWNWGVSGKLQQEIGDLELTSITAFRRSRYHFQFDLDFSDAPAQEIYPTHWERQFTQELQLQPRSSSGRLKWVVGAYYFNSRGGYDPNIVALPVFGITAYNQSRQKTESIAGYAQATYEILPRTNLTLGGRYTHEKRNLTGTNRLLAYGTDIEIAPPLSVDKDASFSKFTFRISLDHKFTDNLMVYASFNRGFKSGGFNAGTIVDAAFRPEVLDAYEAGFKSELLDKRLRLNGAAFYYDYKDIQVQIVRSGAIGILNGASARIYGADLDLEAAVTDNLRISGGVELLDPKFKSFPNAVIGTPQGGVPIIYGPVNGHQMPVASKFTANTSVTYTYPLDSGAIKLNGTAYYNSGWFSEPDNIIRQPRFIEFNASLGWEGNNGLSVSLWGKNLSNRRVNSYASTVPEGTQSVLWAPPRTYGITVGGKF